MRRKLKMLCVEPVHISQYFWGGSLHEEEWQGGRRRGVGQKNMFGPDRYHTVQPLLVPTPQTVPPPSGSPWGVYISFHNISNNELNSGLGSGSVLVVVTVEIVLVVFG